MFPDNLTRAEARARAALIRTESYLVEIDLSSREPADGTTTFRSVSTIRFHAREAGDLHVDLIAEAVLSASLDGVAVDPSSFAGSRLPLSVTAGDHEVTVDALCRYSRSGEGLHRFVDPADGRTYLYTQFEPADARRMFADFEQPDLKATFTISVIAPERWTVISNGAESGRTPLGKGLARWDFATTERVSPYLTALVAGDYHVARTTHRAAGGELELGLFCRASLADHLDADRLFATTTGGFGVFEEHFAYPYPFGKYDQVFVPEYNSGAMENIGCVVLRDEYVFRGRVTEASYRTRDDTILHELSHMWFGDLVTMTWWDDLWLKESFATWSSHFAAGELGDPDANWASFCNAMKTWAYRQDQLPSTHPIAADMVDLEAVELNFDGITYAKGASVLLQLVAFVGRDAFLEGVRRYFAQHAFGNTQLSDLLDALAAASGRDLSGWSAQWLETAGVNTISANFGVDADGRFDRFALRQTAAAEHPTLRDHRLAIGLYALGESDLHGPRLTRIDRLEVDLHGASSEISELVGRPASDLVLVNDDDLTYAKVRLDARSLQTVLDHMHELPTALSRAVCWGATWDMCRDAELPGADYVRLVLRGAAVESDLTAVNSVLGGGWKAATTFSAPAERDAVLIAWQDGVRGLLDGAESGSDHQLAFVRAFAAAARDDRAADALAGWLDGRDVPRGLVIDSELRWTLVRHLARLGRLDEAGIAAEESRDRTVAGAEYAAAARAARPTAEAKEAAWRAAVEENMITATTQRAICQAFWQPGQDAVLAPYIDRYLAAATDISEGRGVWAQKGTQLRTNALTNLFPAPTDLADLLQRVDAWLPGVELADYARRIIAERRDDAARSLRCQQAAAG
ncbi:MAG TPA: aminopeptidase N [Microlunatus sp.]|nr:aminopeptidase N [Microlunatus sp.]